MTRLTLFFFPSSSLSLFMESFFPAMIYTGLSDLKAPFRDHFSFPGIPFLGEWCHHSRALVPGAGPMAKWLSSHAPLQWPRVHGFGSWAQTYTPFIKPCCGGIPHTRTRMTYAYNIQVCTGVLGRKKKEGRLATYVSSGPIFLIKKDYFTKVLPGAGPVAQQ